MPRPLKRGILGARTIILFIDIDKYAFMCGSNFYESDVKSCEHKTVFILICNLTKRVNQHCRALEFLKTIWICLIFI